MPQPIPARRRAATWRCRLVLFLATCLSTFWTGAVAWKPIVHLEALYRGIGVFAENLPQGSPLAALWEALAVAQMDWRQGLLYMGLVLGILLTHEMGHFLMTLRHRIPASLPYFIPLPVVPFGTLGAVIGMEGSRGQPARDVRHGRRRAVGRPGRGAADHLDRHPAVAGHARRPAKPLLPQPAALPMADRLAAARVSHAGRPVPQPVQRLSDGRLDGDVGDGLEHAADQPARRRPRGLCRAGPPRAHILARGLLVAAILFIIATEKYFWVIMLVLVILLGTDHPPTADDRCPLGWVRRVIGWVALLIPDPLFPAAGHHADRAIDRSRTAGSSPLKRVKSRPRGCHCWLVPIAFGTRVDLG